MSSSKRAYEAHLEATQPQEDYPVAPDNKLAAEQPKGGSDE